MGRSRVPEKISEFNNYINLTDKFLQEGSPVTNWQRLGLTLQEANDWKSKREFWRDTLYKAYSSSASNTSLVKKSVKNFMKTFRAFASPLINTIAISREATPMDANTFRFVLRRSKRTFRRVAISDELMFKVMHSRGGVLTIKCRMPSAEGRARKPDGADSVQIAYRISDAKPVDANDGTLKEIFTKTIFQIDAQIGNQGKKIFILARWYNTKHPQLASPWTVAEEHYIA
jgi:hypothetical protein